MASSFSVDPVASTTTASWSTSTTLARKTLAISMTWARTSGLAPTLTSHSSRLTVAVSSSSTILRTLTSLLSCLVTCSSGWAAASTTIVMRETLSTSVSPTASESMLKPRRENSPATRARTPGRFSTRTLRVCLAMCAVLLRGAAVLPRVG